MNDFKVLIVSNSNSDLTLLKFKEFEILNVQSEEFLSFCENSFTREEEFLDKIEEDFKYDRIERYAIVKKSIEKFGARKIDNIFSFLLILFPSVLTVEYILNYNIVAEKLRYSDSFYNDQKSHSISEKFLTFENNDVKDINNFIELHFSTFQNINYLKSSIQHYLNAFDSNYSHFSFIAFCICLESITDGNAELVYRIARNVAVICGKDEVSSMIIFKNIKKAYALRSKIVHGSDFSDETVSDYLYYLELICSKLIVELLKHNITKIENLNEKITSLGFGQKEKISIGWQETTFNKKIENKIYSVI